MVNTASSIEGAESSEVDDDNNLGRRVAVGLFVVIPN